MRQFLRALILGVLVSTSTPVVFGQERTPVPWVPPVGVGYPTIDSYTCTANGLRWQPPCTTPDPFGGYGKCFYSGWWTPDTVVPPDAFLWNVPQRVIYVGAFRVSVPEGLDAAKIDYRFSGDNSLGTIFVCNATRSLCTDELRIPTPQISLDVDALPLAPAIAPWGGRETAGRGLDIDPEIVLPPNVTEVVGHVFAVNFSKTTAYIAKTATGEQVLLEYSLWDIQREQGRPHTVLPYAVWPYYGTPAFTAVAYHGITWPMSPEIPLQRIFGLQKVANTVVVHVSTVR